MLPLHEVERVLPSLVWPFERSSRGQNRLLPCAAARPASALLRPLRRNARLGLGLHGITAWCEPASLTARLPAEQHRLGAPRRDGVRPVPALPGERAGHQLQVPRLQVFESCTKVRQGRVPRWEGSSSCVQLCPVALEILSRPSSWTLLGCVSQERQRSLVLKGNCGICCDAGCPKNLPR